MDHKKIYDKLIKKAVLRENIIGYSEKHHIVPICLGGSDEKFNLVKLTAREHFIAHYLLAKIHGGSLWHAVNMMSADRDNNRYFNSRFYEVVRRNHAIQISISKKGVPQPWVSKRQKGAKQPWVSERQIGVLRPDLSEKMKGNKNGSGNKGKIRHDLIGKKRPVEIGIKISETKKKKAFDKKCIAINALINSIFI